MSVYFVNSKTITFSVPRYHLYSPNDWEIPLRKFRKLHQIYLMYDDVTYMAQVPITHQWAFVKNNNLIKIYCQRASRAKTRGWWGGGIIEPCESTAQAEKISSDL